MKGSSSAIRANAITLASDIKVRYTGARCRSVLLSFGHHSHTQEHYTVTFARLLVETLMYRPFR